MLNWEIALILIITGITFWFYKTILPVIIKKRAQNALQHTVFPEGEVQKAKVLTAFHAFTNNRFTNDQVLDYFIKIKGLQNLNIYKQYSFWTKRYLQKPTEIKLNYFEQVSFYEAFLNYPRVDKEMKNNKEKGNRNSHTAIHGHTELDHQAVSFLKKEFA
jgi:hypothetical protein